MPRTNDLSLLTISAACRFHATSLYRVSEWRGR